MSLHQIAAVVLNWNGKEDTLACLHSLYEQAGVKVEVIMVDNDSADDSVVAVTRQFPKVAVIETGTNLGYAAGNNLGITYALDKGFEYIMVLNNDTILAPECISRLLADLQLHSDAAAAAPMSFYFEAPETIYFAGGRVSPDGRTLHIGSGAKDGPEYNSACDTEWLTGCAILFRGSSLKQVGLFEPQYYLLYEDADWSLRARRKGYRLRFVPEARLWHKTSQSFGKTWSPIYLYYYTRNSFLWIERNFSLQQRPSLYYFALKRVFNIAALQTKGLSANEKHLIQRSVYKGIFDYLFRSFGQHNYS